MGNILPWIAGQLVQAAHSFQGLNEATDQIEMVFFNIRTGNEEDARPALQGAERDVAVGLHGEDLDSGILAEIRFLVSATRPRMTCAGSSCGVDME